MFLRTRMSTLVRLPARTTTVICSCVQMRLGEYIEALATPVRAYVYRMIRVNAGNCSYFLQLMRGIDFFLNTAHFSCVLG